MSPAGKIAEEIRCDGPISFVRYMELALYGPGGYYRQHRTGKSGDFYTSVSVGPCFGCLLADWIADRWNAMGSPGTFSLIEQGAANGALMLDILTTLRTDYPDCFASVDPILIEPLEELAAMQREMLANCGTVVGWVDSLSQVRRDAGIFFCNELLDAFPVHLLRRVRGAWQEMAVRLDDGDFHWTTQLPSEELLAEIDAWIPCEGLPDGYVTEFAAGLSQWMRDVSAAISRGCAWIGDYGFDREEYYAPHRSSGTLRAYRQHRPVANPLETPGEIDLTTHVDWSRLQHLAASSGWNSEAVIPQGAFLTRVATLRLKRIESAAPPDRDTASWLRQFQTLTHPAHLGRSFQVLTLHRQTAVAQSLMPLKNRNPAIDLVKTGGAADFPARLPVNS